MNPPENDSQTPACLFLPGMTLNGTFFPPVASPSLAIDFTELVVSPTGDFPPDGSQGMDFYMDRLDEVVGEWEGWQNTKRIIVAHSFGGMLALSWLLANREPESARIDGLVLCSTTAGPMFDKARLTVARFQHRALTVPLRGFMNWWNRPTVTHLAKRWFTKGSLKIEPVDFQKLSRKTDAAVDRAGWRCTDWRAMRSFRLAMDGFDVREQLGTLDIPTIVLHGARDRVFPPDVGEELAALIPNATLRMIPDAAHALPLTHPEVVLRAIGDLGTRGR